jgi:hypothetical protein
VQRDRGVSLLLLPSCVRGLVVAASDEAFRSAAAARAGDLACARPPAPPSTPRRAAARLPGARFPARGIGAAPPRPREGPAVDGRAGGQSTDGCLLNNSTKAGRTAGGVLEVQEALHNQGLLLAPRQRRETLCRLRRQDNLGNKTPTARPKRSGRAARSAPTPENTALHVRRARPERKVTVALHAALLQRWSNPSTQDCGGKRGRGDSAAHNAPALDATRQAWRRPR